MNDHLTRLAALAHRVASSKRQRVANASAAGLVLLAQEKLEPAPPRSVGGPPPIAPPLRWPTRRQRRLATAVTINERATVEQRERGRWVKELGAMIREAQLPLAQRAQRSLDPEAAFRRYGRGRRASTLRTRIREWRRLRDWMQKVHKRPWPTSAEQVVDLLEERALEPCGRTCFTSCLTAVIFAEAAGEVPLNLRLSADPVLLNAVEDLELEAASLANTSRRQAPPTLPIIVLALELHVLSDTEPSYSRAFAWYRLLRFWGTLRFDDTMGIAPASIVISSRGLSATIDRTKTTGPGKRVEHMDFSVSAGCYLVDAAWLTAGYELWKTLGYERDYLLAPPTKDMEGLVRRPASYADSSACSRALLSSLPRPVLNGGGAQGVGYGAQDRGPLVGPSGGHLLDRAQR